MVPATARATDACARLMTDTNTERAIRTHANTVWRVCVLYLGAGFDAQDAFQETFARMCAVQTSFSSEEHRKAWLIRVATNICKDIFKRAERANASLEESPSAREAHSSDAFEIPGGTFAEVFDAMAQLPREQRGAVYLSVVEGYTAAEIGIMMGAPANTVYTWISKGKKQLKEALS